MFVPICLYWPSIGPVLGQYRKTVPVLGRYWTNTGYAVLVQYRASTNKLVLARYRPSIGSVLGQYCMCGIGPILGQYKQFGTGPVSGLYWANTEKLFLYWAGTGPIPDMRYWANTGPVQTNQYWPGIGPVLALYRADTVKWYLANTNTVCKTVPGWYWLAVLGQYRQRYWASTVMFAGTCLTFFNKPPEYIVPQLPAFRQLQALQDVGYMAYQTLIEPKFS